MNQKKRKGNLIRNERNKKYIEKKPVSLVNIESNWTALTLSTASLSAFTTAGSSEK